jgi:regulatory protein
LRLLGIRPRGRVELERALRERGFEPAAVAGALERLETQGLLDDLAAARSAVRQRGTRYGRARVERELKVRGISKETIAAAFEAEGGAEREQEELARLFRKLWKSRADLAPPLRRRRVFEALVRRGFRPEKISEIIRGWYEVD